MLTANPSQAWIQVAGDLLNARAYNSAISGQGLLLNINPEVPGSPTVSWPRADPVVASPAGEPTQGVGAWFLDCTENDWGLTGGNGLADPQTAKRWQASALKLAKMVVDAYPGVHLYLVINCTVSAARRPVLRALLGDTATQAMAEGATGAHVLEFPAEPDCVRACEGHPNARGHQSMGEQAATAVRGDLGW